MKTPISNKITRASLTATAAYNARWFASLVAGTTVLSSAAVSAATWTAAGTTDWNTASNWNPVGVPGGVNATINLSSPQIATISANITATPVDIQVGYGAGSPVGRLDQTAGTATTGNNNWMLVGAANATANGTYNLANTAASGGAFTNFGTGTGTMTVGNTGGGGRLYVGGDDAGGDAGTGVVNVNTSGSLIMRNDLIVGSQAGTGTFNLDNGIVSSGSAGSGAWTFIGQEGGHGTLNMSGGSITSFGRFYVGRNGGATGTVNMTGGTITKNTGEIFVVSESTSTGVFNQSGGSVSSGTAEFWVGEGAGSNGTYNLSGTGSLAVANYVAIGRTTGTGALNITGGTFTKTGATNTNFLIGSSGAGTLVQSGGLIDVQTGNFVVAESNTGTATLSGTGEIRTPNFVVGQDGSAVATLHLDGGTVKTARLAGGAGTGTVSFNGTQLVVKSLPVGAFIENLDTATIDAGGLKVDTNGISVASPQTFDGTGSVTKSGAGTLTLSGINTYTGSNTVSAGKLIVGTKPAATPGTGSFTVANNAGIGVILQNDLEQYTTTSVSFGSGSTLDINAGFPGGNPSVAVLEVSGAVTLNGNVAVNLIDAFPEVGTYQLAHYGSKIGTGSFVLGTLPQGVLGTLSDVGGVVSLNVTSVALPRWDATASGNWDTTTFNWKDLASGASIKYSNGNPVLFEDFPSGVTAGNVTITQAVTPGSVVFNNSGVGNGGLDYVLSATGAGKIGGTTGITKQGAGDLSITNTNNDYTGVTSFEGGTISTALLTNGGVASPIGAATADPSKLAFAGGTLNYTGPTVTINRGYSIAAADNTIVSGLKTTNNLTISGQVTTPTFGKFTKTGAGTLALTNPGANVLANGALGSAGVSVDGGTLLLDGSGTQTNTITGELWVASKPDIAANLTLNNTSLSTTSWLAIGRGNGSTGTVCNVSLTNSTLTTANMSSGFDAGLANNLSTQNVTLSNSTFTNNGNTRLAESLNSTTHMTIGGTSVVNANGQFLMALATGTVCDVTLQDSGKLTQTNGWMSVGTDFNGSGTLTVKNSASLITDGDFNVSDVAQSQGVINLSDTGSISLTGNIFIGKAGGATGTVNQTGGTFTIASAVHIAYSDNAIGIVNVSGGTFSQSVGGLALFVAEGGDGTLNISGTGQVIAVGNGLVVTNTATANGVVNLDGGTLTTRTVFDGTGGAGNSTFNFNGGVLKAGTGADAGFMAGLDVANVKSGGAKIDTNGNNINIGQALLDGGGGGGLTKSGTGTLALNGVSTYTGPTAVNAGGLGGTGTLASAVSVAAGASLAPGSPTGTLTVASATFAATGKLEINVNDASAPVNGALAATGNLNITNATLQVNGTPTGPLYVIASYGTLTGAAFASVPSIPGYTINYNYNGLKQIALVGSGATPYTTWIGTYFPGITDPAIVGPDADPDGDGGSNRFEFALGGNPNSVTDRAKVFPIVADGGDVGTNKELLLTIAVRSGTPAFTGSPSPTASRDGFTYTIQGSADLAAFGTAVTVDTPYVTGLPTVPAGYEYRTFTLSGSDGVAGKGFVRVQVTP